jgi:hypothetical protein
MASTNNNPSDYKFRIVFSADSRKLTWHSIECATGKNATCSNCKLGKLTVYTPETRREAYKTRFEAKYGPDPGNRRRGWNPWWLWSYPTDHMAKCCLGKNAITYLQAAEIKKAPPSVSFTTSQARKIFEEALAAGRAAGVAATPTPMVVGTPTTFLGDVIDHSQPTYYVPDGVCGFAWVVIRPGNSSLARHAVKLGIGRSGGRSGGGVRIWIRDHDQSLERKNRHARAYADVLRAYGVMAYAESRMD